MVLRVVFDILKKREGLSLTAYPDFGSDLGKICRREGLKLTEYTQVPHWKNYDGKPWTIGFGHALGNWPGKEISLEEAETILRRRIREFEKEVVKICEGIKFKPNDNQFAAMICFSYNCGADDLYDIVKEVKLTQENDDSHWKFCDELKRYAHSRGELIPELKRRRIEEATLFMKPISFKNVGGDSSK